MTGNKPHARAIAPSDYAEAVVFDFVNPTRSYWRPLGKAGTVQ